MFHVNLLWSDWQSCISSRSWLINILNNVC